jgi:hypothetical protein
VPFFVFVITLVIIVVVIVLLVLRLLAMLPSVGSPGATGSPTPTNTLVVVPAPSSVTARTPGPRAGSATRIPSGKTALLPLVFATGYTAAGGPLNPARTFSTAEPRIYAFATLSTVPAGAIVRFLWSYGPTHTMLADVPEHRYGPAYAKYTFTSYATPDRATFAPGLYIVSVTLGSRLVAQDTFHIVAP